MALSLSITARSNLRDLLTCFSVGNLCFLRRWYDLEHLKERSMDYYRTGPADLKLFWATLIAASLLTAALWLAWSWLKRHPSPARWRLARCGFLLLLIFPLESVRRYWNQEIGRFDLGSNLALVAVEALLAAGVVLVLLGNTRVMKPARHVAFLLSLLFPSLVIDLILNRANAEPASAFLARPPLPMLPPRAGPQRRVIWVVFDEFDQRLAFDVRPPSVDLPELDRLRAQSVVASHATQTAPWTIIALPSLLSGRVFSRAELIDARTLRVYPEGAPNGLNWRDQVNVFKEARAMGVNAELVGWHHPYCRVLGDSVVRCFDMPGGHPTEAMRRELTATDQGIPSMVATLFRLQLENLHDMLRPERFAISANLGSSFVQQRQLRQYFMIRDHAYAAAVDPRIGLLFVHFPAPHLFAIYDRKRKDFTLGASIDYFDNLALVDRTVGEMRRALEREGVWENTTLVITSDHGLRPDLWRARYNWTPELQRLTEGGASDTVPLIVKLAGRDHPLVYDKPFSNVVTGALSLAILSGQVTTAAEAAAWLEERVAPRMESSR